MATSNEAEKARHALRRRRRLRQVLGAVVCVLVVIGLASVISGGVRLTASLFDDTEEKEEFELRLQTLVSLDPEPFDSLESANRARLLDAAIWSVIQQNSDSLDTYERDEVGAMYLPTLDIDRAVASLYGPDFHFNYETFTDNGLTFQYVPEKNAYLLPITSVNGNYSPRVMQIDQDKGKYGNEQAAQNRHEPQRDGCEKAHVSDGRADLAGQCAHISRHTAHLPGHRAYNAATKCRKYRKAASGRRSS